MSKVYGQWGVAGVWLACTECVDGMWRVWEWGVAGMSGSWHADGM